MSCPTQKSFNEKISRFLEKMLFNVFGMLCARYFRPLKKERSPKKLPLIEAQK